MRRIGVGVVGAAALALTLSGCGGSGGSDVAEAAGNAVPAATPAAGGPAPASAGNSMAGMSMGGGSTSSMPGMNMTAYEGDGKAVTVDGYTLASVKSPKQAGKPGTLTFVINGPNGKAQTDFTLQQNKLLHLYVVRADLTGFQHLHPTLDPKTGLWSLPITFDQPGPYRLVAEFEALKEDGNFDDRILGADLTVAGAYQPVEYTPAYGSATVDGYAVSLDRTATVHGPDLHLHVTKGGADVTDLQQYLESYAHITGFRQGDLTAVHVHPNEVPPYKTDPNKVGGPILTLASLFTTPGNYRLFVEFQTDGVLHEAPIDVKVG